MEYPKTIRNFYRSRCDTTVLLMITIVWFFLNCQNKIVTIKEVKGTDWEQYIGKPISVEGIFVKDTIPMLVTDLKIVIANVPMPDTQYLLLSGKKVESIDPQKFGGAKILISGKLLRINKDQFKYVSDKVVLDVLSYEILEVPEYPYAPEVQNMAPDSLHP